MSDLARKDDVRWAERLVEDAREQVMASKVVENSWAHRYVSSRPHDVQRYALDLLLAHAHVAEGGRICDHASAPFVFARSLSLAGYDVTATDLDPARFGDLDGLGIAVVKLDLERAGLKETAFDAVFFSEIFEHCRIDLIGTIEAIRDSLKPGGLLFLSTPNLRSLSGLYNFLFRAYAFSGRGSTLYKEWIKLRNIGHCGHVREYTSREVADLLSDCGMEIERVIYRGTYKGWVSSAICGVLPLFRPYFTIVAKRV